MNKFSLAFFFCLAAFCNCESNSNSTILCDKDASKGQFPHQVSIRYRGNHICGGAIVSRRYILTGAYCIYMYTTPTFLNVRVGSVDRFKGGALLRISKVTIHEKYNGKIHDLAVVKLEEPIIFSKNIQPIPLATEEVRIGANVIVSGWGLRTLQDDLPRKLQWHSLTAISPEQCNKGNTWYADAVICLAREFINDSCTTDYGGPAIYNGEIVGIYNFCYRDCGVHSYTNIFYHLDWIRNHTDLK